MGYHRAFPKAEIVGVDNKPMPHYPFEFVQADALEYPLDGFDLIHASPPCQAYIQRNKNLETRHPKLIEPTRERVVELGVPYVIENVEGAPLLNPSRLCGTMFSLLVLRHRLFETSFPVSVPMRCNHWGTVADGDFAAVYAFGGKGHRHGRDAEGNKLRDPGSKAGPPWDVAMGISWMTKKELAEAIPPTYTEYIGNQLKVNA